MPFAENEGGKEGVRTFYFAVLIYFTRYSEPNATAALILG